MSVMNNDIEKTILSEAFTYVHNFTTCTVLHVLQCIVFVDVQAKQYLYLQLSVV